MRTENSQLAEYHTRGRRRRVYVHIIGTSTQTSEMHRFPNNDTVVVVNAQSDHGKNLGIDRCIYTKCNSV